MTNEERAKSITDEVGGNYHDCLDWLNDGDVEDGDTIAELIADWIEVGKEYSA